MAERKRFTIIANGNSMSHPVGTVCYEFWGHDYGCAREDAQAMGKAIISLTLNEDGSGPFFTAQCDSLDPKPVDGFYEPIDGHVGRR